ncbi:MAG: TonB-dependent receptor [Saprospiraceae bacterium]|nr:TonB-dependent receptor [Saprospiraceae bacterium]
MQLTISFIGYTPKIVTIIPNQNQKLDVDLDFASSTLQTVEVKATPQYLTQKLGLSSVSLPIKLIKELPAFLGEKDPLKVFQLMPGVSNPREGFSGLFVRGGDPGQNLFLLDDAIVYNAYHLFGFFPFLMAMRYVMQSCLKGLFPLVMAGAHQPS